MITQNWAKNMKKICKALAKISISLLVLLAFSLIASAADVNFGDIYLNKTASRVFTVTNSGGSDVTGISITHNLGSAYNLTFNRTSIPTLAAGKSEDILATIYIPFSAETKDSLNLGTITASGSGGFSSTYNVIANTKSYLSIEKLTVFINGKGETLSHDGEKVSKKVQPEDTVELDLTVENIFKSTGNSETVLRNVEIEINVIGIDKDEDDISFTSDKFDLEYEGNERKYTAEFNFTVPPEAKEGTHEIEIIAKGSDKYGNNYRTVWRNELAVERESHDLVITKFDITPNPISCVLSTSINFEITNAGSTDEEYARYVIKNSALGINIDKMISLSSDPEDEQNKYRSSAPISFTGLSPGSYPIEIYAYYDVSIYKDSTLKNLIVAECSQEPQQPQQPITPTPPQPPAQQPPVLIINQTQQNAQQQEQPLQQQPKVINQSVYVPNQPVIAGTLVVPGWLSSLTSNSYVLLLIIANGIVMLLIIAFLIYRLKK
jgi:hypothetical protein